MVKKKKAKNPETKPSKKKTAAPKKKRIKSTDLPPVAAQNNESEVAINAAVLENPLSSDFDKAEAQRILAENGNSVAINVVESSSLALNVGNVGTLLQTADDVAEARLDKLIVCFMVAFKEAAEQGNKERISFMDADGSTCFENREEALFFVELLERELFEVFAEHDVEVTLHLDETCDIPYRGTCYTFVARLVDASAVVPDIMQESFDPDMPGHVKLANVELY